MNETKKTIMDEWMNEAVKHEIQLNEIRITWNDITWKDMKFNELIRKANSISWTESMTCSESKWHGKPLHGVTCN